MIRANQEGGRIEFFRMNPDPFLRNTFWTVSIGTTFQWLTSLGIHPGAVQRFVALPTYGKAQKAAIFFVFGMGVVKILTSVVGMLIYSIASTLSLLTTAIFIRANGDLKRKYE
ncbi:sodium-coupled monocarboxylate transporter 2-like, partial [Melanaphis sacchari]|uniref:sodium-coupled monocarboxylate transporter 2-like n=1 Tax=Melanaphis sacchari TaxID=742174 RepID=UPI000DC13BFF